MEQKLSMDEIERRFVEIDAGEAEEPTAADLAAFTQAEAEDPADTITLEAYKSQREYGGKLMLRIPKELHRQLAEAAKENGVSLNQYALYKLAK